MPSSGSSGSQDPALFDRTVVDNVAYGCDFANDKEEAERVRAALGAAQATSFVEVLPAEKLLGERGSALSGGQRQRLAIARAIARGAVASTLTQLASEGHAVLVAAHRLRTVARAHRIVVLDGGTVVEEHRSVGCISKEK
eukprot:g4305.t1